MLKAIAFVASLSCLAGLMFFGERISDGACPANLAYLKSQEILERHPGVVDVSRENFRWVDDCKFAMTGHVDIDKGDSIDRAGFEVVVALDPNTAQWREISLAVEP